LQNIYKLHQLINWMSSLEERITKGIGEITRSIKHIHQQKCASTSSSFEEIEQMLNEKREPNKEEKRRREKKGVEGDEVEDTIKKLDLPEHHYSFNGLDDFYNIQLQESFYVQRTDYSTLFSDMGRKRNFSLTYSQHDSSAVAVEDYAGEMTGQEAEKTVQKLMIAKMFHNFDDVSAVELERFRNWRHFNKTLRRLYEAQASLTYKEMRPMKV
jgi:hypothetical protein